MTVGKAERNMSPLRHTVGVTFHESTPAGRGNNKENGLIPAANMHVGPLSVDDEKELV